MKTQKMHFIRLFVIATLAFSTLPQPDANAAVTVQIGNNFTASTFFVDSGWYSPNTDGAIGPNHFVEFINGVFSVFDKTTGANVFSTDDVSFWSTAGVDMTGLGAFQTRIVYDKQSQRWFACEVDYNQNDTTNISPNRFLLAVSTTTDPTGTWHGVAFLGDASGNNVVSPNLGLDANGVYVTSLVYDPSGYNFVGTTAFSIPKADLLQAIPSTGNLTGFGLTTEGSILQPVINFNPTAGPETFLETDYYNASTLTTLKVSNAATAAATLGAATTTNVLTYSYPTHPFQPSEFVQLLLAHGASVELRNDDGQTPRDLAELLNDPNLKRVFGQF